jgi:hypothetical protein
MPTGPKHLSREMTLCPMRCVSYLIGVYLTGTAHLAKSLQVTSHQPRVTNYKPPKPQESDCPESENVRRITYEFISKLCKTNPILSASGGFKTLYLTKTYVKTVEFHRPKTNPNEPKRTQSKPNFPRTPKSTQPVSLKGLTQKNRFRPKSEQTQTNPIFRPSGAPKAKTNPNEPNFKSKRPTFPVGIVRCLGMNPVKYPG